jgi:hypothetical protein
MKTLKVFFGSTTKEIQKYKDYYFAVRQELINNNCVILDDWLPRALEKSINDPTGKRNGKKNFEMIIDAINRADFVVIEYSATNFSSTHQILHSLFKRKPTLVLRLEKDNTYKDSYMEWMGSEFLTLRNYNLKNLSKIIKEFIGEVEIGYGLQRFNLVLERKHKYFLDWATENYKKSRSELVRGALDKIMEGNEDYLKYLAN